MKRILITIVSILAIQIGLFAQVTIPNPIRHYALNGNAYESVHKMDGKISGKVWPHVDRFGRSDSAISFDKNAFIATPNFFQGISNATAGTISFWVYVKNSYKKNTGQVQPWEPTDTLFRAFFAEGGNNMMGFSLRRDRVIVETGTVIQTTLEPFGIWYWDPVNITEMPGWYMVVLTYTENQTHLYMFTPAGRMVEALTYFGFPKNVSRVTRWGFGNIRGYSVAALDDFSVYAETLSKEQVKQLYANEGVQRGNMYLVSSAYYPDRLMRSDWPDYTYDNLSLFRRTDAIFQNGIGDAINQWVFEPVPEYHNTYHIRLPYIDHFYLTGYGVGKRARVDHSEKDSDWIVTPAEDGYFFIRWRSDQSLYLTARKYELVDKPEVILLPYDPEQASMYKWKLELVSMRYELENEEILRTSDIQVIDNYNTVMGLIPQTPIVSSSDAPMFPSRASKPSLLSHYYFKKGLDNGYRIQNRTFYDRYVKVNNSYKPGTTVLLSPFKSLFEPYYIFKLEQYAPLSRRYKIVPILGQSTLIASNDMKGVMPQITLSTEKEANPQSSSLWQLFHAYGKTNGNGQLTNIKPGLYKIYPANSEIRCFGPTYFSHSTSMIIKMPVFNATDRWYFYWFISPEQESDGRYIFDGSYTLRAFARDDLFFRVREPGFQMRSPFEYQRWESDNFLTYKWYFVKESDGTYTIRSPKFTNYAVRTHVGDDLELGTYDPSYYPENFKFRLERVELEQPIEDGVYYIRLNDGGLFLRPNDNVIREYQDVEIETVNKFQRGFYWRITRNDDGTYFIRPADNSQLYLGTESYSAMAGRKLVLLPYNAVNSASIKWVISSSGYSTGEFEGSLNFRLAAYPDQMFMQAYQNKNYSSNLVEVNKLLTVAGSTGFWIVMKAE